MSRSMSFDWISAERQSMALQANKEGVEPLTGKQPGVLSTESSAVRSNFMACCHAGFSESDPFACRRARHLPKALLRAKQWRV